MNRLLFYAGFVWLMGTSIGVTGQSTVTGRLVDKETGRPVMNATIIQTGTDFKTTSNALGFFQLQADSTTMVEIISSDYPPMHARVPAANSFKIELTKADTTQRQEFVEEEIPSFPGGYPAFYEYLQSNMKLPREVKNGSITGKVFIEFVIEKDGQISPDDIIIKQSLCKPCDEEAVRLIKGAPNWNPGTQNGKPVRSRMVLPIPFK